MESHSLAQHPNPTDQSKGNEKDCAWCKLVEQKLCKTAYDAFDECMEREGDQGDEKCMELFDALRACMAANQKPSLATVLRSMLVGPTDGRQQER